MGEGINFLDSAPKIVRDIAARKVNRVAGDMATDRDLHGPGRTVRRLRRGGHAKPVSGNSIEVNMVRRRNG